MIPGQILTLPARAIPGTSEFFAHRDRFIDSAFKDTLNANDYTTRPVAYAGGIAAASAIVIGVNLTPTPQTISQVNLKGIFQGWGKSLADEGKFFGWEPKYVSRRACDVTKDQLLKRGYTPARLDEIRRAYENIARITPGNPSAAGRARRSEISIASWRRRFFMKDGGGSIEVEAFAGSVVE